MVASSEVHRRGDVVIDDEVVKRLHELDFDVYGEVTVRCGEPDCKSRFFTLFASLDELKRFVQELDKSPWMCPEHRSSEGWSGWRALIDERYRQDR